MKKIAVFLFEGAELFEIATFTDIFGWNNVVGLKEFRDIKLETISYKESIKCTWGGEIKVEKVITEVVAEVMENLELIFKEISEVHNKGQVDEYTERYYYLSDKFYNDMKQFKIDFLIEK